jgi:CDP-diglyceride synthetase
MEMNLWSRSAAATERRICAYLHCIDSATVRICTLTHNNTVVPMQLLLIVQFLCLLALANGMPVIAKKLMGIRLARPLDGGATSPDGRPWFGSSKTIRGIVLSVLATALAAVPVGFGWRVGVLVAIGAMAGDLFSSFLKRRMNLAPSSQAIGLDQIPESLFPAVACQWVLGLTTLDVVAIVILFFFGELALSRLLFNLHVRDRPY